MATKTKAPDVFAKAAALAEIDAGASTKPATVWNMGDGSASDKIAEFLKLAAESKALKTRLDAAKASLTLTGDALFFKHIAEHGEAPPATVRMVGKGGKSVAFVSKDCADTFKLKNENHAALDLALGKVKANGLTELRVSYSLDSDVLAEKTPAGTVRSDLAELLNSAVNAEVLTADQVARLLVCTQVVGFKPGLFASLIKFCGKSAEKLGKAYAAVGSASTRYVQP